MAEAPEGFDFLRGEGEDLLHVEEGGERLDACSGLGGRGDGLGLRGLRRRGRRGGESFLLLGVGAGVGFGGYNCGCFAAEVFDLIFVGFFQVFGGVKALSGGEIRNPASSFAIEGDSLFGLLV